MTKVRKSEGFVPVFQSDLGFSSLRQKFIFGWKDGQRQLGWRSVGQQQGEQMWHDSELV